MLAPIRAQQCWARKECGVQLAPMLLPDARSSLEREVFWRNDAPKDPRDGQRRNGSAAHNANAEAEGREKGEASGVFCAAGVNGFPATLNSVETASSSSKAHGVGKLFNRALEIHGGKTPSDTAAAPADGAFSSSLAEVSSPVLSSLAALQQTEDGRPSLWGDRATLLRYSLSLEKDRAELESLAFVVNLPADRAEAGEWTSFEAPALSKDEAKAEVRTPRVFAMDCEMVLVANNVSALARITLLDVRAGAVVLDTLVKPATPVVDYITRYSGVDEAMLDGVTTTLRDCQRELKRHIDRETFVVGHSLENDFKACKMLPNCHLLDTAHLFPHPAGLPYKNSLRYLAQRYLQKRIQQGSHDSAEDASTSAELVHLKLQHGPGFGIRARVSVLQLMERAAAPPVETAAMASEGDDQEQKKRDEAHGGTSVFPPSSSSSSSLEVELNLFDDACVLRELIPSGADARNGSRLHAVPVRHDRDAVRKAVRCLQQRERGRQHTTDATPLSYTLTWVQLTETVEPQQQPGDAEGEGQLWEKRQLERVDEVNRRVMQIVCAAPHNSLIVVLAGRTSTAAEGASTGRTRGVCFAFVKDDASPGPPAVWLDVGPEPTVCPAPATAAGAGEHSRTLETPPACRQQ
ncbi:hypothetical protein TRSC58_07085 [Trypanosoma rangeli SC58]|uniref:Exonuclease domain-containing protein n=1 Tax=Trypanosoma rangeli SC58 TaxID=429131 RepID=A0A061ITH1_TRYRA|nr:hypothetical protein TRSC58_07085 [Trypanosoma rangeli SC58]